MVDDNITKEELEVVAAQEAAEANTADQDARDAEATAAKEVAEAEEARIVAKRARKKAAREAAEAEAAEAAAKAATPAVDPDDALKKKFGARFDEYRKLGYI